MKKFIAVLAIVGILVIGGNVFASDNSGVFNPEYHTMITVRLLDGPGLENNAGQPASGTAFLNGPEKGWDALEITDQGIEIAGGWDAMAYADGPLSPRNWQNLAGAGRVQVIVTFKDERVMEF